MRENIHNLENQQLIFIQGLKDIGRSFNTIKNYQTDLNCFNQFLKNFPSPVKMNDLNIPLMEEYGTFLFQKYPSDNSRRRRVQTLRMFCDHLIKVGLLKSNPVRKLSPGPKFRDIPRPSSLLDIRTFWKYQVENEEKSSGIFKLLFKRNQLIFLLIYTGGLKVSDIENLLSEDIVIGDVGRVIVKPPKRDPYSIPLTSIFPVIFKSYVKMLEGFNWNQKELLFNANPYKILSGGLSARGLEKLFEDARKKLKIEITPKSLRQSCILRWLKEGHSEGLIKEWMGVAPSYDIKPYRDFVSQYHYTENFLKELFHD
jgi:site-specific recombinase XerD